MIYNVGPSVSAYTRVQEISESLKAMSKSALDTKADNKFSLFSKPKQRPKKKTGLDIWV